MALLALLLLVSSFTVFAEELDTLPPSSHPPVAAPPHYHHPHPHPHTPVPTPAPVHPPSHPPVHPPHHHHHHHHHPPAPAPAPVKPPVHPPTPVPVKPPVHPPTPVPVKPPTHHYPPTPAPVKPPTPAPVKPPTHQHYPPTPVPVKPPVHPPVPVHPPPPVLPPVHPVPRSFVAVQGVVFAKSCKYAGVDTLLGATPVLGAIVKLQCNNTKYRLVQTAKTDKNGYFYVQAPKTITSFGAHKCLVYLVSEPTGLKPSNLHGGVTGSVLRPEKPFVSEKLPFLLYTVGPLAFEPKCAH